MKTLLSLFFSFFLTSIFLLSLCKTHNKIFYQSIHLYLITETIYSKKHYNKKSKNYTHELIREFEADDLCQESAGVPLCDFHSLDSKRFPVILTHTFQGPWPDIRKPFSRLFALDFSLHTSYNDMSAQKGYPEIRVQMSPWIKLSEIVPAAQNFLHLFLLQTAYI